MLDTSLLTPAVILVIWSIIILFWMAATRLPAAARMGRDITASVGGRGEDIDPIVPPNVAWKSHNYKHLMEQPTLYYAVIAILTLAEGVSTISVSLAWAYVVLRIIHSLWQVQINTIRVRFILFLLSTFCLIGLAILALIATI
ncbi:MAPEG family protein [Parasphingorhabdus sp. DH2-15]|uniref:MAPEG family protein n=1 Tax=Parasphingorhabdus sp. DH2-15 TaxID=3444112 RepID=UPI003F68741C